MQGTQPIQAENDDIRLDTSIFSHKRSDLLQLSYIDQVEKSFETDTTIYLF